MGCFFSSPDESVRSSSSSSSTKAIKEGLLNTDGTHKTSAWTDEFDPTKWIDDIDKIWRRKLSDLPVHMDIPRLGHKIRLIKDGEAVAFAEESDPKPEIVRKLFVALATALEESEEFLKSIDDHFYEVVKREGTGDISQQLSSFLQTYVAPDSRFERVLKLCHQKMVFPAFYYLKHRISGLVFKDARGTWDLTVSLLEGGKQIRVEHSKCQVPRDVLAGEQEEYSFRWTLAVLISGPDLDQLESCTIHIKEISTRPDLPESRVSTIREAITSQFPLEE